LVHTSLPLFAQNSSIQHSTGSLNDDLMVRNIITASVKRCGKTREQIGEEMSITLAITVTARMLTAFTSESKELHRWPGAWDRAFCFAVGDDALLKCRVEAAGYRVITVAEAELLDLGREYLRQKRAAERMAMIEAGLRGMEDL
jgi:hypothetical protein